MSESAYLTCSTCEVLLPLGKPVRRPDGSVAHFHRMTMSEAPNSVQSDLTRALWKFLADHAEHPVGVKSSYDEDFDFVAGFAEIGGDAIGEVSFEEYLRDWPG